MQRFREAAELAAEAVELAPQSVEIAALFVECADDAGDPQLRRRALEHYSTVEPRNPTTWVILAQQRLFEGDRQGAAEAARQARARMRNLAVNRSLWMRRLTMLETALEAPEYQASLPLRPRRAGRPAAGREVPAAKPRPSPGGAQPQSAAAPPPSSGRRSPTGWRCSGRRCRWPRWRFPRSCLRRLRQRHAAALPVRRAAARPVRALRSGRAPRRRPLSRLRRRRAGGAAPGRGGSDRRASAGRRLRYFAGSSVSRPPWMRAHRPLGRLM